VLGIAAIFGALGAIGAAYSAHWVLVTPHGPQTTAGPAWLLTGLGTGAAFGALLATGAMRLVHRRPH